MMKTKRLYGFLLLGVIATSLIVASCTKNDQSSSSDVPANKQNVSLYMTDGAGFFDNVFIDIRSVQALVDTCDKSDSSDDDHGGDNGNGHGWDDNTGGSSCAVWEDLDVKAGVYDLLTLRNGVDTLMAQGNISTGSVKKIRITLGTNNSLVKDSITYPLNVAANASVTIILKGHEWDEFMPKKKRLWLDFDIARSIVQIRNNEFHLIPVIHCFTKIKTGAIEGRVQPREAYSVISAWNNADTVYALPDREGRFSIHGLQEGSYTLFVNGSNGYADTTINNVSVSVGQSAKLETIILRK